MSPGIINSPSTTSSTTKSKRFFFVNGNESEARKHAMREHWKKRKERNAAGEKKYKSLQVLRPTPEKEPMDCKNDSQSYPDAPIPIQYPSYNQNTTSIVAQDYPWEMSINPDEEKKKAVLVQSQPEFYPCGTSQVLKATDPGGVGSKPRAHGVHNLRVSDASIMPVDPDCRIHDSVYTVGDNNGTDVISSKRTDLDDAKDVPYIVSSKL